jgi:nucleotide-binding universal stress UspA family protein
VVVGYDGSQSSRNALAYATGLARRLCRPLLVVYVVPFGVYCEPMTGQVICASREKGEMERWLISELNQVCDAEGLEVSVIARRGNAAKELAAAADVSSADALVVGAPGHRLHHVVGSIPSWLARHARCPVIVVP